MKKYVAVLLLALTISSCNEKTPNRDYIPVLKQQVYLLQEAVRSADRTKLDSLLIDDLRESGGADSLVRFVAGPEGQFRFAQFAHCEIFYNDDKARADCVLVDESGGEGSAVTLTLANHQGRWLLKRFEVKPPDDAR